MKKFFICIALVIMVGLFFAGCGGGYENLDLVFEKNEIVYVLGSKTDDIVSVDVNVKNFPNIAISASVTSDVASVLRVENIGGGDYRIFVKVQKKGNGEIYVKTLEGDKSKSIKFVAVEHISSLSDNNQKIAVLAKAQRVELNWQDLVAISPYATESVSFSFSLQSNQQGYSVTAENGKYFLNIADNAVEAALTVEVVENNSGKKILKTITTFKDPQITAEKSELQFFVNDLNDATDDINNNSTAKQIVTFNIGNSDFQRKDLLVCEIDQTCSAKNVMLCNLVNDWQNGTSQIYNLSFANECNAGNIYDMTFDFGFLGYKLIGNEKLGSETIKCEYDSLVKEIRIAGLTADKGTFESTIYRYSDSQSALRLAVSGYPTNTTFKKLKIKQIDEGVVVKISNKEIAVDEEFVSGSILTFKLNENTNKEVVSVSFVAENDDKIDVEYTLTLNVKEGVKSIGVISDSKNNYYYSNSTIIDKDQRSTLSDQLYLVSNSNTENSATIKIPVEGTDIELADFEISSNNVFILSKVFKQSDKFLELVVSAKENGKTCIGSGWVKIKPVNLSESLNITTNCVNVLTEDGEDIQIKAPYPQINSDVAKLAYDVPEGDFDLEIHIKVGSSVPFEITPNEANSNIDVSRLDFEKIIETDTFSGTDVVDLANMLFKCNTQGVYSFKLKVPYFKVENGKKVTETTTNKELKIKLVTYYPIQAVTMSNSSLSTYSLESVGSFREDLATKTFKINVLTSDSTNALQNAVWDYFKNEGFSLENHSISTNFLNGNDVAISSTGNGIIKVITKTANIDRITISITQYSKVFTVTLRLNITEAQKVEEIKLSGVGEVSTDEQFSYMIEKNVEKTQNSAQIIATPYPQTAFNKELIYEVFTSNDDVLIASSEQTIVNAYGISITNSGLLSWANNGITTGIDGYLRISAKDAWFKVVKAGAEIFEPKGVDGNIKLIKLKINDGKTAETAYSVYSYADLLSKCDQTLSDDITTYTLNKFVNIANSFQVKGDSKKKLVIGAGITLNGQNFEITDISSTLFDQINGTVKNLVMKMEHCNTFLINTNKGTIENCYIYGTMEHSTIETNEGTIKNVDINYASDSTIICMYNKGILEAVRYFGEQEIDSLVGTNEKQIISCLILFRTDWENTPTLIIKGEPATNSIVAKFDNGNFVYENNEPISDDNCLLPTVPQNLGFNWKAGNEKFFKFVKNSTTYGVLYFYQVNDTLSALEQSRLQFKNTYNILSIGTVSGETNFNSRFYTFEISKNDVIRLNAGKLEVIGTSFEPITITVTHIISGASFAFEVYAINPVQGLEINVGATNVDPTTLIDDNITLRFKRLTHEVLFSSINNTLTLESKQRTFNINDYEVVNGIISPIFNNSINDESFELSEWKKSNSSTVFGLRSLYFRFAGTCVYQPTLKLKTTEPVKTATSSLATAIGEHFKRNIPLSIYNGAENINTNVESVESEPYNTFDFNVTIKTDKPISDQNPAIRYEFLDENKLGADGIFEITTTEAYKMVYVDGFTTYVYRASAELKNKFDVGEKTYFVRIYPNEDPSVSERGEKLEEMYVEVKLIVKSQTVISLSSSYYASKETSGTQQTGASASQPFEIKPNETNNLVPGGSGILKVDFTPYYAYVDRFEIGFESDISGYDISLIPSTINANNKFVQATSNYAFNSETKKLIIYSKDFSNKYNGLIYKKDDESVTGAQLNIMVITPSAVPDEIKYTVTTSAFMEGQEEPIMESSLALTAKYIPTSTIICDDSVGRATWNDFSVEIIDTKDNNDFNIYVTDSYKNVLTGSSESSIVLELDKQTYTETTINNNLIKRVYNGRFYVGALYGPTTDALKNNTKGTFKLNVQTRATIDGVTQNQTCEKSVNVYNYVVKDFYIEGEIDNTYHAYVNMSGELKINLVVSEPVLYYDSASENVLWLQNNREEVSFNMSLKVNDCEITEKEFDYFKIIKNSGNIYTVLGKAKGSLPCVFTATGSNNNNYSYNFFIDVDYYTTEDKPIYINNKEDFEKFIINNASVSEEKLDYILMSDLEFDNWEIIANTANINSLDGNNKIITINSFKTSTNTTEYLSIFNTVSQNTTLKNLTINYALNAINLENDTVHFAGIAIRNSGIIANCQIMSIQAPGKLGGVEIKTTTKATISGLVEENEGYISNSRVGLVGNRFEKVTAAPSTGNIISLASKSEYIILKDFVLIGCGDISGFVTNNGSVISNSYFCGEIIDKNESNEVSICAGFVSENTGNGTINGSYTKGTGAVVSALTVGAGITTKGFASGFVHINRGKITDSYAQINIADSASSASAFVYSNTEQGVIFCCHTSCRMKTSSTNNNFFSGVDDKNNILNLGKIDNCYYFANGQENTFDDGTIKVSLNDIEGTGDCFEESYKRKYLGFCFVANDKANDGVWLLNKNGVPELVSANEISISVRIPNGQIDDEGYQVLVYLTNYKYGSFKNPILIRSMSEFNKVFVTPTDSSSASFIENKTNYASYRIICNLDMSALNMTNPTAFSYITTTAVTLQAKNVGGVAVGGRVDGNSMLISNLTLATGNSNENVDSFGLFKSLSSGAMLKNMNLSVAVVANAKSKVVGGLVGTVVDSYVINSSVLSEKIANDDMGKDASFVKGMNITGGVIGLITGNSTISRITSQVSVMSLYVSQKTEASHYTNYMSSEWNISYAGGAIGVADLQENGSITNVYAHGNIFVSGYIVGGTIGYIGSQTKATSIDFGIEPSSTNFSSLEVSVYNQGCLGFVGNIVGELKGSIANSRVYHSFVDDDGNLAQDQIENGVASYYNNSATSKGTYESLFDVGYAKAIGGIAGVVTSSKAVIEYSYAKNDIISPYASYIGGLVGYVDKASKVTINNCYHFGNLFGDTAKVGLIFGAINDNASESNVSATSSITYFDKTSSTDSEEVPLSIAGESNGTNAYTCDNIFVTKTLGGKSYVVDNFSTTVNIVELFGTNAGVISSHKSVVFNVNNGTWDGLRWDMTKILPELKSVSTEEYYYLYEQTMDVDVYKLLNNPFGHFKLVSQNGGDFDITSNSVLLKLSNLDFYGSLEPYKDDSIVMKVCITTTLSKSLFKSLQGATISNLIFDNISIEVKDEYSNMGVLSQTSLSTLYRNVTLDSCSIKYLSEYTHEFTNVGIVAGEITNAMIQKITIQNCSLGENGKSLNAQNIGLLAGKSNGQLRVSEIVAHNCSIYSNAKTTESTATVGGLVGYALNVNIGSFSSGGSRPSEFKISNITISFSKDETNNNVYIGGAFGSTEDFKTETSINICQDTAFKDTTFGVHTTLAKDIVCSNFYYGGFAGKVSSSEGGAGSFIDSSLTGHADGTSINGELLAGGLIGDVLKMHLEDLNTTKTIKFDISKVAAANAKVGGLIGVVRNEAKVAKVKIGGAINIISSKVADKSYYVGGMIGNVINNVVLTNCSINIPITFSANVENYSFYGSEVIGSFKGVKISINSCFAYGDISLKECRKANDLIYIGSVAGSVVMNEKDVESLEITNCYSDGDIELFFATGVVSSVNDNLCLGGFVGYISSMSEKFVFAGNVNLVMLKNKVYQSKNVNAFVGIWDNKPTDLTVEANYFCPQLCLAVETVLSDPTSADEQNTVSTITPYAEWKSSTNTTPNIYKLTYTQILDLIANSISDPVSGSKIKDNNSTTQGTKTSPNNETGYSYYSDAGKNVVIGNEDSQIDWSTIGNKSEISVLSGLKIVTDETLMDTNNGYIFGCDIVSDKIGGNGAAICNENKGYIGFTTTDCKMFGNNSSAFVGTNSGIIESCSSVGAILGSGSYAFVGLNSGVVANSYTTAHVEKYGETETGYIVGSNSGTYKNFFFDQDYTLSKKNMGNNIDPSTSYTRDSICNLDLNGDVEENWVFDKMQYKVWQKSLNGNNVNITKNYGLPNLSYLGSYMINNTTYTKSANVLTSNITGKKIVTTAGNTGPGEFINSIFDNTYTPVVSKQSLNNQNNNSLILLYDIDLTNFRTGESGYLSKAISGTTTANYFFEGNAKIIRTNKIIFSTTSYVNFQNLTITGNVAAGDSDKNVGALVGKAENCIFKNITNSATVTGKYNGSSANLTGSVGGVAGYANKCIFDSCVNTTENFGISQSLNISECSDFELTAYYFDDNLENIRPHFGAYNANNDRSEFKLNGCIIEIYIAIGEFESGGTAGDGLFRVINGNDVQEEDKIFLDFNEANQCYYFIHSVKDKEYVFIFDKSKLDQNWNAFVETNEYKTNDTKYNISIEFKYRALSSGKITSEGNYNSVGGIVGYAEECNICYFKNNEKISSEGKNSSVGGVVGYAGGSTIMSCENAGQISSTGEKSNVGGVVGYASEGTTSYCENVGQISSTGKSSNVGGIVGYADNCEFELTAYYFDDNLENIRPHFGAYNANNDRSELELNGCIIEIYIAIGEFESKGTAGDGVFRIINVDSSQEEDKIFLDFNEANQCYYFIHSVKDKKYVFIFDKSKLDQNWNGFVETDEYNTNIENTKYNISIEFKYRQLLNEEALNTVAVSPTGEECDIDEIVGDALDSSISNCQNYGVVSSTGEDCKVGGIAARIEDCSFSYCINNGKITSSEGANCYIGGIVGYGKNNSGENTKLNDSALTFVVGAGGPSGYIASCLYNEFTFTLNHKRFPDKNSLTIEANDKIILNNFSIEPGPFSISYEHDSKNYKVMGIAKVTSDKSIVVSSIDLYSLDETIIHVTNNGEVNGGKYAGGIIGRSINICISDCNNFGNCSLVNENSAVGGIVGNAESCVVCSCENAGEITSSGGSSNVGGIVGSAAKCSISFCENSSYNTLAKLPSMNKSYVEDENFSGFQYYNHLDDNNEAVVDDEKNINNAFSPYVTTKTVLLLSGEEKTVPAIAIRKMMKQEGSEISIGDFYLCFTIFEQSSGEFGCDLHGWKGTDLVDFRTDDACYCTYFEEEKVVYIKYVLNNIYYHYLLDLSGENDYTVTEKYAPNYAPNDVSINGGDSNTSNCGGIVGLLQNTSEITNCNNSFSIKGAKYAGGIVGKIEADSKAVNISSCTNSGSVSATYVGGGIAGATCNDNEFYWITLSSSEVLDVKSEECFSELYRDPYEPDTTITSINYYIPLFNLTNRYIKITRYFSSSSNMECDFTEYQPGFTQDVFTVSQGDIPRVKDGGSFTPKTAILESLSTIGTDLGTVIIPVGAPVQKERLVLTYYTVIKRICIFVNDDCNITDEYVTIKNCVNKSTVSRDGEKTVISGSIMGVSNKATESSNSKSTWLIYHK